MAGVQWILNPRGGARGLTAIAHADGTFTIPGNGPHYLRYRLNAGAFTAWAAVNLPATITGAVGDTLDVETTIVSHTPAYVPKDESGGGDEGGGGEGGGGGASAPLTAIGAEGWDATYPSPPASFAPDTAPQTITVKRAGFDGNGDALTFVDTLTITSRVRLPYPNHLTLHATRVSMSDVVYADDQIFGVTNGSLVSSPKPVANWARPARQVVGNVLAKESLELVAFHREARGGEQVACVEWTISDGTNTISAKASASVLSGLSTDKYPVIVYRPAADIDISALADETTLTINAKVYPHVGVAASVADSAVSANAWEFSPRTFRRSVAKATAPFLVYVAVGGSDTTGAVSADPAIAAATPCATLTGALKRLKAVNGNANYGVIRLTAGTFYMSALGSSDQSQQTHSELVIEAAPGVPRSDIRIEFGSSTASQPNLYNPSGGEVQIRLRGLNIYGMGTSAAWSVPGSGNRSRHVIVLEDCTLDLSASAGGMVASGSADWYKFQALGLTIIYNGDTGLLNASSSQPKWRLSRGLTATSINFDAWLILGSRCNGYVGTGTTGAQRAMANGADTGSICAFSFIRDVHPDCWLASGQNNNVGGLALVQCVLEYTQLGTRSVRVSADDASGSTSHVLMMHNTVTGFNSTGRANFFYDEGSTPRTNKLMAMAGNLWNQVNFKTDTFAADGSRTGNWQYDYGAGCQGEFAMFTKASTHETTYKGLRAKFGTSNTVRLDPLFADYKGTDSADGTTLTAGAGGGNYQIGVASPAKGLVKPVLKWDLAGAPRTGALHDAGAYEAAA
ncbi:hypothetical protein V8J36_05220 [Frigidibacter sp. MR17.14]|uniref:hypothetical protein n=1 Tax=Frigidibacter sp. MR17.14 TaxID=3126509 RepID=UPI003012FA44